MGRHAKTYEIAVGDEKPDIVHYIMVEGTGEAQDLSAADAVKFSLYNLDTKAWTFEGNAASFVDLTAGKVKYVWDTGGATETDTAGRFFGVFTVYWGATSTDPMTPTGIEITIKEKYERVS